MNIKNIILFGFLAAIVSLVACKSDGGDDPTGGCTDPDEKVALELIIGTWSLDTVTKNDEAVPETAMDWSDMTFVVNASLEDCGSKTYTVTGGNLTFPDAADATWTYQEGTNYQVLVRADGVVMRIMSLTADELILRQDQATDLCPEGGCTTGGARTIGTWLYTFSPN